LFSVICKVLCTEKEFQHLTNVNHYYFLILPSHNEHVFNYDRMYVLQTLKFQIISELIKD